MLVSKQHIPFLIDSIMKWPVNEKTNSDIDSCFGGLIDMLRLELLKCNKLKHEIRSADTLAKSLLGSLFDIGKTGASCKNEKTRGKALKLLELLVNSFSEAKDLVKQYLFELHRVESWRSNKGYDWSIDPKLKSRVGRFIGLYNLGATCYMNSSLQQLFMIPQFRKGILEAPSTYKENSVLYQLQLLFYSLMETQREVHNPKPFTQTIMIDGRPMNLYEQKDVDEFLVYLMEKLEQELVGTVQEKLIKETFKITFANEIICNECPYVSTTTEEDISVILSIKNKKTIYEGLKSFIKSDILEGDNAYYCERCEKKVTAHKRQIIKTLHNTLTVVLKRFEFNFDTMERVKVNDRCEFPQELDLEEFTQEGQACMELNKALDNGSISKEDLTEDQKRILQRRIPKYYYQYKLKGIIVHCGYADSGHYYSYILNREDVSGQEDKRWFEFNDSRIRSFDSKKIPEETFGGVEEISSSHSPKKGLRQEKIRNAYVLIYERIVPLNPQLLDKYKQEEREVDSKDITKRFEEMKMKEEKLAINIPEFLDRLVNEDNKKFWLTQYIFHPDYLSFILHMSATAKIEEYDKYIDARNSLVESTGSKIDTAQFYITFLLTIALRAETKDIVPEIITVIKTYCEKDIRTCLWICKLFSYPDIIQEFLIDCPNETAGMWVVSLLSSVIRILYPIEKAYFAKMLQNPQTITSIKDLCEVFSIPESQISEGKIVVTDSLYSIPYLVLMMNAFIRQVDLLENHNFGFYFQVLCYFAYLGPEARRYLNCCSFIGICFEHLMRHKNVKGECINWAVKSLIHIEVKSKMPISALPKDSSIMHKIKAKKSLARDFAFELIYRLMDNVAFEELKKPMTKGEEVFKTKLSETEVTYLNSLKNKNYLKDLMGCVHDSKAAVNYYGKLLATACFNNDKCTEIVLEYLLTEMKAADLALLKELLQVAYFIFGNKEKTMKKCKYFFEELDKMFRKNQRSQPICECFIDFIIKLFRNNDSRESLKELMNSTLMEILSFMKKWLTLNYNNISPSTVYLYYSHRKKCHEATLA